MCVERVWCEFCHYRRSKILEEVDLLEASGREAPLLKPGDEFVVVRKSDEGEENSKSQDLGDEVISSGEATQYHNETLFLELEIPNFP